MFCVLPPCLKSPLYAHQLHLMPLIFLKPVAVYSGCLPPRLIHPHLHPLPIQAAVAAGNDADKPQQHVPTHYHLLPIVAAVPADIACFLPPLFSHLHAYHRQARSVQAKVQSHYVPTFAAPRHQHQPAASQCALAADHCAMQFHASPSHFCH